MRSILNNMLLPARLRLIMVCYLVLQTAALKAQFVPEAFSKKNTGTEVYNKLSATSGAYPIYLDTVQDDKFLRMKTDGSWRADFKHKSVTDLITISVKDTTKAMGRFDYLFYLTVDTFDYLNRHGSFNIVLRFSYDPRDHRPYTDKAVFKFKGAHRFFARVTGITDSASSTPSIFNYLDLQTNFNIESEILIERYYLGSYTTAVSSLSRNVPGANKLRFSWVPPSSSAPNQYALEWCYIDTAGIKPDSLKYDFIHNSSRVLLSATSYTINAIYDAGIILYRVRRIKPDSVYYTYSKYSSWLPNTADQGYVKDYSSTYKIYITGHEGMQKNWDYQVAFAEEGLKKEVVNYFDGSLKRRQGVTLMNTQNFALVDESVYDNHGREAIKIIPAPSDSNTIRYYHKFNQNGAGAAYSSRDFDTSTVIANKCDGTYTAKPLGTGSGAGRYYSSSNPDKTNENAAIPDALGYPLVQTQLMPDPTGRVFAQGGVGKTHQLGSGHETKYFYGSATQEELDALFGSETGIASHYKRNAVVDPNGQMSISYIDQHGRVVATALTGGVPGMVDTLSNFTRPAYKMTDLAGNTRFINNAIVMGYEFDVTNSGTHKIYYKVESPDFTFGCVGLRPCYTCRYDLELRLDDDCGTKLLQFKRTIGQLHDTACSTPLTFSLEDSISTLLGTVSPSSSGDSISFSLGVGHYRLSKILTVNTDSLENKIEAVINADSSCYKTFADFLDDEMDAIDFSDCTCDTCGSDSLSYCESRKQLMAEDVSPGGQYFMYDPDTYATSGDSTSIFRKWGNKIYYQTISHSLFKDDNGKLDTVIIDGTAYTPNNLTIEDFVNHFNPSWTEALLRIHPEYCYYKYCIDSLEKTNRYDDAMMEIESYDTALLYGYLDPLDYKTEYAVSNHDPYFFANSTTRNAKGNALKLLLDDMSAYTIGTAGDPLTIGLTTTSAWQLAMATGFCEDLADTFERQSCFKFYTTANIANSWMNDQDGRDNYWNKFKALYYQVKHKYIEGKLNTEAGSTPCVKKIGPTCSDAHYHDKLSHFIRYEQANPLENNADSIQAEKERLLDSLSNFSTCEADVADWDRALVLCPDYQDNRDSILYHLLQVCRAGSLNPKTGNALGMTDIPENYRQGHRFVSFDAVLKHFLGSDYKSELCNLDLINSPHESTRDLFDQKPREATDCICEAVKEEVRNYKGCVTPKDSSDLSTEGKLVNEYINLLVTNNLLNITTAPFLDNPTNGLANVGNKLFAPVLGGTAADLQYTQNNQGKLTATLGSQQKMLTVYLNSDPKVNCSFAVKITTPGKDFDNLHPTKTYTIKPVSAGHFKYRFYYVSGDSSEADVYTSCFSNLLRCDPAVPLSDMAGFTTYFNLKYSSALSAGDVRKLLAECGSYSKGNFVGEKNTIEYAYEGCNKHNVQAEQKALIRSLNQMMRNPKWWLGNMQVNGWFPGAAGGAKRTLTTNMINFRCNDTTDFLLPLTDYKTQLSPYFTQHNYWWRSPKKIVTSFTTIGDSVMTVHDTTYANNYHNDPYFAGGFWIGAKCTDLTGDSSCFTSFGDPYHKLGTSAFPTISQIDSLNYLRWDDGLGAFVVSAYDRSHATDSVVLTFASCFSTCNKLTQEKNITIPRTYLTFKPGAGNGYNFMSGAEAKVSMDKRYISPFMDMLNGLARVPNFISGNQLSSSSEFDIRILPKLYKLDGYYDKLIPIANGYVYKKAESNSDSMLSASLGTETGAGSPQYCRFVLRKTGSSRSWSFADIDVFKDLGPDPQGIATCAENGQPDMAGYYFTLQAGKINAPGDTTWYDVRGWSSCWQFSHLNMISGTGKNLYNLPDAFAGNCQCMTCPQVSQWIDSLQTEYPRLYPLHANYSTILPNYLNRKLNTNLSFTEIQTLLDGCDMGRHKYMPMPQCDYRLVIKNSDYPLNGGGKGHADTMLLIVMQQCGFGFGIEYTKTADSTAYCLNFNGLSAADIAMVQDTIYKYFNTPYFDDFTRTKNYRTNADILVYSRYMDNIITEGCSRGQFETWAAAENSDVNVTAVDNTVYTDNIDYYEPSHTSWMAALDLDSLTIAEKFEFLDSLNAWATACGHVIVKPLFYQPALQDGSSGPGEQVCLDSTSNNHEVCYRCDVFKHKVLNYQYDVAATRSNPPAAMRPDSIAAYLSASLGIKLEVYQGDKECLSCSNQSLFICEAPSDQLNALVELLNKVATDKKLNNASYTLGSGYTTLLNRIKPAGVILNAPKYQFTTNAKGGWYATLKYNTHEYDRVFFRSEDIPTQSRFGAGIISFNHALPDAAAGTVSNVYITTSDSLYGHTTLYLSMTGLKATACCDLPNTMLCPQPATREYEFVDPPCKAAETGQAIANATENYGRYRDSVARGVRMAYQTHCLTHASETFKLGQYKQRYHLTLYYYDQAGNLLKTAPPAGETDLTLTSQRQDSINTYRNDISQTNKFVNTWHKLPTNYEYNSLNQLVHQRTPDGGESRFWYDRLGRLVLSQNARQAAAIDTGMQEHYSYTRYDALGRIAEVGEIINNPPDEDDLVTDITYFNTWLAGSTSRTQITKTFYDYAVMPVVSAEFPAVSGGSTGQRNLRNRVSAVCYYDFYAADSSLYSRATFYSYDIHGNVDHLVHDFPDMAALGHRFKHLAYEYDLISGKVHSVAYQEDQADQWLHRYNYDADNRLTLAETSTDKVIWDKDAEYKYYKHGPLARTVIGEHAVQGVDYVYTLHGWLKGVNSNTLRAGRDVGKDGTGALRTLTARDAYGFTLGYFADQSGTGYFDGDYQSIGTTSFEAATSGSPLGDEHSNLYNGNITHMVSAAGVFSTPLATAYRYDQLNRISTVKSYQNINLSTNAWNSGSLSTNYSEKFTYDANGNILTLKRYAASTVMDQLTYHYQTGTNRLTYVDDAIGSGSFTDDIDDQAAGNYHYDDIGNLNKDIKEDIDTILWNVYGKITDIERTAGSTRPGLTFRYDAMGQRVLKIVKHSSFETDWTYTWYVRDAQGNVMATYTKKQLIDNDTSLYRLINNAIVADVGTDHLADFIRAKFAGSQFNGALADAIVARGLDDDLVHLYEVDSLMTWDPTLTTTVMNQYCSYVSPVTPPSVGNREALYAYMWTYNETAIRSALNNTCFDMSVLLPALLDKDVGSDEFLNLLASIDYVSFEHIYATMGGSVPPASVGAAIAYMRGFSSADIATAVSSVYTVTTELSGLSTGLLQSVFDSQTGSFDFCVFLQNVTNCDPSAWYGFVRTYVDDTDAGTIIDATSDPTYLVNLVLDNDTGAIRNIAGINTEPIADALKETPGLDIARYLIYIYRWFGSGTYSDVIAALGGGLTIEKSLTLEELHIYGSSRHGIRKPKVQLVNKTYVLDGFSEDGALDIGAATDSTMYMVDWRYSKRTLTYKQYEMTNHLGNVLATILDRKTAYVDSAHGDTLMYYTADISTAQFYYAFGSPIQSFAFSDTTNYWKDSLNRQYRYGFNGEEKMDDLSGEGMAYDLGARFYDSRLGRMFSTDPKESDYPYWSTYSYCGNNPVTIVDINGAGTDGEGDKTHTIASGETLGGIAKKYNTTVKALLDANSGNKSIKSANLIIAGGTISIPAPKAEMLEQDDGLVGEASRKKLQVGDRITKYKLDYEHMTVSCNEVTLLFYENKGWTEGYKQTYNGAAMLGAAAITAEGIGFGAGAGAAVGTGLSATGVGAIAVGAAYVGIPHTRVLSRAISVPYPALATQTDVDIAMLTAPIFHYCTYTKYNASANKVYVGRTCGFGTPADIVKRRDYGHGVLNSQGYGAATLDISLPGTFAGYFFRVNDPSYWAIRGREQLLIESYRNRGMSGNAINGISPLNTNRLKYLQEALKHWR